jgi:hypothetical protein
VVPQVRSFIGKNFDLQKLQELSDGNLPDPPPLYQPPPRLALLFADPNTKSRVKGLNSDVERLMVSAVAPTSASAVGGWDTLLSIAAGIPQQFCSDVMQNLARKEDVRSIMSSLKPSISKTPNVLRAGAVKRSTNFSVGQTDAAMPEADILDPATSVPNELPEENSVTNVSVDPDNINLNHAENADAMDVVCISDQGQWKRSDENHNNSSIIRVEYGALHSLIKPKVEPSPTLLDNSNDAKNGDGQLDDIAEDDLFGESHKTKFGLYVRPMWKKSEAKQSPSQEAEVSDHYINFREPSLEIVNVLDNGRRKQKLNSIVRTAESTSSCFSSGVKFSTGTVTVGADEPSSASRASTKKVATVSKQSGEKPKRKSSKKVYLQTADSTLSPGIANSDDFFRSGRVKKKAAKKKAPECHEPEVDHVASPATENELVPAGLTTPPVSRHSEESNLLSSMFSSPNENSMFGQSMLYLNHNEMSVQDGSFYAANPEQGSLSGFEDGTTSFFGGSAFMDGLDFAGGQNTNP